MPPRRPAPPSPSSPPSDSPGRRYGGKSAAARAHLRRAQLLDAGLSLFGTAGYSETSIAQICEQAQLTARYFYEGFRSREALLTAVYDSIVADTEYGVRAALEHTSGDLVSRLARALRAFLRSYLDDPRRGRIVCVEVVGVSPELERHRRADLWRFARLVDQEIRTLAESGVVPRRDSRYTALALAGATHELVVEWLTARVPLSVRRLEREVLLLFLATLAGSTSANVALGRQRRADRER